MYEFKLIFGCLFVYLVANNRVVNINRQAQILNTARKVKEWKYCSRRKRMIVSQRNRKVPEQADNSSAENEANVPQDDHMHQVEP
jgi:hypothetical protein